MARICATKKEIHIEGDTKDVLMLLEKTTTLLLTKLGESPTTKLDAQGLRKALNKEIKTNLSKGN